MTEHTYKQFDLMEQWKQMPLIPRDHEFKGIPLDVLDDLGWRWDKGSYFIPYFNETKTAIPFGQWRHLSGDRRFTFLKDAKPTVYGKWNLAPNMPVFIVEGASDAAVLDYCNIPWLAMPSAASGALMRSFAEWAVKNNVRVIYGGDRDEAGDKLKDVLEEIMPYRLRQAKPPYKDYGEMFAAEGQLAVIEWCSVELGNSTTIIDEVGYWDDEATQKVMAVFPGSTQLEIAPQLAEQPNQ